MNLQTLMSNYAGYNTWANSTLIRWLKAKPETLLFKEVPSSFSGILKTLNHIWAAEEFWYSVIAKTELRTDRYAAKELLTDEVLEGLLARSEAFAVYVASLSDQELQEELDLDTPWVKGKLPRYEYIQHVLTHSAYHRGQITSMGHRMDLHDAPITDYNYYNMVTKKNLKAQY